MDAVFSILGSLFENVVVYYLSKDPVIYRSLFVTNSDSFVSSSTGEVSVLDFTTEVVKASVVRVVDPK